MTQLLNYDTAPELYAESLLFAPKLTIMFFAKYSGVYGLSFESPHR